MSFLQTRTALFVIATLVFWLNFTGHYFSALPFQKYIDGEFRSERFAFSRLVHNLQHGTQSEGGFLLAHDAAELTQKSVHRDDYADFKRAYQADPEAYTVYNSHYGLQDDLMFPIWQGLEAVKAEVLKKAKPNSRWHTRLQKWDYYYYNLISRGLVALLNAAIFAAFLLWAAKEFTLRSAWVAGGLMIVLMPVLGFYGQSIWWMQWRWFLPALLTLWTMHRASTCHVREGVRLASIGGGLAVLVCINAMMGYEFLIPSMVGAMVPVAYYAVKHGWGVRTWFVKSFVLGCFALAGALAALYIHYDALKDVGVNALDLLQSRFEMRSHGGETVSGKSEIAKSVQQSVFSVYLGYLTSTKELSLPQLVIMAPFFVWLKKYLGGERSLMALDVRRQYDAFIAAIAMGMMGGFMMLTIFKGHAHIHGYDIVIWAIPTNIFLMIFYAQRIMGLARLPQTR